MAGSVGTAVTAATVETYGTDVGEEATLALVAAATKNDNITVWM